MHVFRAVVTEFTRLIVLYETGGDASLELAQAQAHSDGMEDVYEKIQQFLDRLGIRLEEDQPSPIDRVFAWILSKNKHRKRADEPTPRQRMVAAIAARVNPEDPSRFERRYQYAVENLLPNQSFLFPECKTTTHLHNALSKWRECWKYSSADRSKGGDDTDLPLPPHFAPSTVWTSPHWDVSDGYPELAYKRNTEWFIRAIFFDVSEFLSDYEIALKAIDIDLNQRRFRIDSRYPETGLRTLRNELAIDIERLAVRALQLGEVPICWKRPFPDTPIKNLRELAAWALDRTTQLLYVINSEIAAKRPASRVDIRTQHGGWLLHNIVRSCSHWGLSLPVEAKEEMSLEEMQTAILQIEPFLARLTREENSESSSDDQRTAETLDGYRPGELASLLELGTERLNHYATTAGVTTPGRGNREHIYSQTDVRRICESIVKSGANRTTRAKAESILSDSKPTSLPERNPNQIRGKSEDSNRV